MVIYARGGTEGTSVEAASRTGRRRSAQKLLVKSLHLCLVPSHADPESALARPTAHSRCVLMKGTDTRLVNNRQHNMNV